MNGEQMQITRALVKVGVKGAQCWHLVEKEVIADTETAREVRTEAKIKYVIYQWIISIFQGWKKTTFFKLKYELYFTHTK